MAWITWETIVIVLAMRLGQHGLRPVLEVASQCQRRKNENRSLKRYYFSLYGMVWYGMVNVD